MARLNTLKGRNRGWERLLKKVKALDISAYKYLKKISNKENYLMIRLINFRKADSLGAALTWCRTPQGHKYWESLRDKIDNHEI